MSLKNIWERLLHDDRRLLASLLTLVALIYGGILCAAPDVTPQLNLTYNSMLQHLLQGRFDVDPNTVGLEGFLHDGRVYAYWGIWGALLRLPLWLVHGMQWDVTIWSCLAAVCVGMYFKLRTLLFVRNNVPASRIREWVFAATVIFLIFGGEGFAFLRASIYQEVVFWAIAFASGFIYCAIVGLVRGEFSPQLLAGMAACTGLAVLTRVSTGLGLCAAFGLFGVVWLAQAIRRRETLAAIQKALPALAVLVILLACAGIVNYGRWGNPLTFANHRLYLFNQQYPDRMPRTQLYGYFNVRRIPFGLGYFFAPLWVLRGPDHFHLLFEGAQTRLMDAVEMPPSSFLLTDLYAFVWIALLCNRLRTAIRQRAYPMAQFAAIAVGLLVPMVLMLTAISMNYRYRLEFYPEINLLLFSSIFLCLRTVPAQQQLPRLVWLRTALIVSVLFSALAVSLYKMSEYGPPQDHLRNGLLQYYRNQL